MQITRFGSAPPPRPPPRPRSLSSLARLTPPPPLGEIHTPVAPFPTLSSRPTPAPGRMLGPTATFALDRVGPKGRLGTLGAQVHPFLRVSPGGSGCKGARRTDRGQTHFLIKCLAAALATALGPKSVLPRPGTPETRPALQGLAEVGGLVPSQVHGPNS